MADRAALVTGASSGIGLAIAEMLGQEGYGLTVAARRPDKLAAAAEGHFTHVYVDRAVQSRTVPLPDALRAAAAALGRGA